MGKIALTKDALLWCMSAIYLFAFVSLYSQIPGLYGDNGILPARLVLPVDSKPELKKFQHQPTLLWLLPAIGLDVPNGMDFICILGAAISLICMISRRMRDAFMFAALWFLYFSVYQVGQTFLWFQWDILLLETGFLTILLAPMHLFKWRDPVCRHHDSIMMWLMKWLLFRLMFASGVVKLTSMCPTWWGLTALDWHYESQCIPTPLAWYAHQLPEWFQRLSVVMTYVIEILLPFLFFSPIRNLRLFAFFGQILLQVLIIITGNYNFFNLLTIALCISLLDDQFLGRNNNKNLSANQSSLMSRLMSRLSTTISLVTYAGMVYAMVKYFKLTINTKQYTVESEIAFTSDEFFEAIQVAMPYTIGFGIASLALEVLSALWRCLSEDSGFFNKLWSLFQCLIMTFAAVGMFTISLVPHCVVDRTAYHNLWPEIHKMKESTDFLHLTHSYGLFRRMTGVGGRPEVIIEGSYYPESGWKPYEFMYKPGNLSAMPPFVAPHQPRLDWQMWFAALGSYEHNKWFVNLIYRLLDGQQEVLDLIAHNPFENKPPKYVRAKLYHYSYTKFGDTNADWWKRWNAQEYLPTVNKDNLMEYVRKSGIIKKVKKPKKGEVTEEPTLAKEVTVQIRELIGHLPGPTLICSLFIPAVIMSYFF
ncbi:lipase maturation factor 2-like [Amphiura filiformis]|uniref:lipase maturation factor 2-like n=1 Tax=Amphiura filiformis TaxID=82378 RepID=UPI003B22843D